MTSRRLMVRFGMAAILGLGLTAVWEAFGPGQSAYAGCAYCRKTSRGCSCAGRCPCHRGGGSGGCGVVGVPLKPMQWETLEAGLSKSSQAGKPLVVVFCTKEFDGPATFHSNTTRDAWKASGAMAVRVLPPEPPKYQANVTPEQYEAAKAVHEEYKATYSKYQELLKKYGAEANPTLVCLAPDGAILARLYSPNNQDVAGTLKALPKAVKAYEDRKAREAEAKAKEAEKATSSGASARPDIVVPSGAAAGVKPVGS